MTCRNRQLDDSLHVRWLFAVIAAEGVFKAALAKLQLLHPEFVLSIGDFIRGYGEGMKPLTDGTVVREKRRKVDKMLATLCLKWTPETGPREPLTKRGLRGSLGGCGS